MIINRREIGGKNHPPYIVAEISGNHGGSKENAIRLIKEAKRAGADAVKTQCYTADSMTLDCKKIDFMVQDGLWQGSYLYQLYEEAMTPPEWHPDLFQCAADEGITIFSSVFDEWGVDFLFKLGCPAFKIASFELVDIPLIEYAASTGKPMVLSTGKASNTDILDAAAAVAPNEACFLHCTSEYPGTIENAGLDRINAIKLLLDLRHPVGLSDHTDDMIVPVVATGRRVAMIEKHIRLPDVDSADAEFSMIPEDFETMVQAVHLVHEGLPYHASSGVNQFRRSLYAVEDIREGELFSNKNVRSIRPGFGMAPKHLPSLLNTPAKRAYRRGDPIR